MKIIEDKKKKDDPFFHDVREGGVYTNKYGDIRIIVEEIDEDTFAYVQAKDGHFLIPFPKSSVKKAVFKQWRYEGYIHGDTLAWLYGEYVKTYNAMMDTFQTEQVRFTNTCEKILAGEGKYKI